MEPKILHLETSGKNCSVAISEGTEVIALCEEMAEQFSHSKKLHTFIQWALEGAEIELKDLDAISVSKGPGSYTGLRIGTSAAKGLAFGLNLPLLSTQSLRTLVQPYFTENFDAYIGTLDARRDEIFYQIFDDQNSPSQPNNVVLNSEFLVPLFQQKNKIIGSGSEKIKQYIEENHLEQLDHFDWSFEEKISAQNAMSEALTKFKNQEFEDLAYFEPEYVKSVHITQKKKTS